MISRLFNTTSRISLTTTVRFFQFSARNTTIGIGLMNAGRAIKGRLLAPSSEKPLVIGAVAVAGTAIYGIGSLAYYSFIPQEDSILQQSTLWSDVVRRNIFNTYVYLFGSLSLTAGAAVVATRLPAVMRIANNNSLPYFFAALTAIIVSQEVCLKIPYENRFAKHIAWVVDCALLGAVSAPLFVLGGPALMRAAWCTAGIVAGLSTLAIVAPSEKYLKWFAPLSMAFGAVFAACIAGACLPKMKIPYQSVAGTNLLSIVFFGGLILFSLLLIYDTQRLAEEAVEHDKLTKAEKDARPFDPINEQMYIFGNIWNIFT